MVLGVVLWILSGSVTQPAPVVLRLAGLGALATAALVAAWPDTRQLGRDTVAALRGDRAHLAALAAVVAIAVAARAWLLGRDPSYDEAYTFLNYAFLPLGEGMAIYDLPNNHLLHTFLVHDVWRVFGESLTVLRLPAFIAGVLTVLAIYAAGRVLYGRAAGLLAAALAAASPPLVLFSVSGRGYSMIWLATALLIALGARLLQRRDAAAWTLWVLTAVLAFYTIPTMALPLATVAAWMAVNWLLERRMLGLAELAVAVAVTALLSYLLVSDVLDQPGWDYAGPPINDVFGFAGDVWEFMHEGLGIAGQVAAAAAVVAGVVLHRRIGRQRVSLPLVALLSVGLLAVALPHPPPFPRTWGYLAVIELPVVAAGALAVARAVAPRRAGQFAAVASAAILSAIVVFGKPPEADAPHRGAADLAHWLKSHRPGTPVVVDWFTYPSVALEFRFAGVENQLIKVGHDNPKPRADVLHPDPSLVVVSRQFGQTPMSLLNEIGLKERQRLKRVRTFDEMDLYALG